MAFDTQTRNKLNNMVAKCRTILTEEFAQQLRENFGIQLSGKLAPLEDLTHIGDDEREIARILRERIEFLVAGLPPTEKKPVVTAIDRVIREQAFTALNRLAALRMAEERELVQPCVKDGVNSAGFRMFDENAGAALGEISVRYRTYLSCVFDELSFDLGVLFDRFSTYGLLFPGAKALEAVLELLNQKDIDALWAEDETIGWIYQYWNSKEERKAMRDASAAPRNSRELAVRNQFFTPRYVVEFLTDNTLGRIWYEMCGGETTLKEQCRYLVRRPNEVFLGKDECRSENAEVSDQEQSLTQEELLKQPVYIPHRPIKDPREIRLLDPACGSMHFGLYAFDLYETIYSESWDIAKSGNAPEGADKSHSAFCTLISDFSSKEEFLREVPRLIIEHNIHGVDIDPRAVQIAGLSLWLRAQKTWKDTPAAGRPRVRRSNIVCAEPMPGSDAMLEDFVQTLDPPLLGELVKTVFDKMQLAGEAGTLLKIEEEIRTAIDDARKDWEKLQSRPPELFSQDALNVISKSPELGLTSDFSNLTSDFWPAAEERIYAALRDYAESAEAGDYQRRLFAEDAAHGFAFIDLCRKRYDAVVMNPPFGDWSTRFKKQAKKSYPNSYNDILAAFVERGGDLLSSYGRTGAITSRTCFFLSSFTKWRDAVVLDQLRPELLVDLGHGVMDAAMVEAAAYVLAKPSAA